LKNLDFPEKDGFLRLKSKWSDKSYEEYRQKSEERKKKIQNFFDFITKDNKMYDSKEFMAFFQP